MESGSVWIRSSELNRMLQQLKLPGRTRDGQRIKCFYMTQTGIHPPAKKFNAGQKGIFWIVILGGTSLAMSGVSLMFPFEFSMFEWTFGIFNVFGFNFPSTLTPLEEMQWSQWWHAIMALIMIVAILGHIYIGSMGMEGAFDAVGNGHVDENWAREHHSLWIAEVEDKAASGGGTTQPAE